MLPEQIGNGRSHDDDDGEDDETRGASLYLEEATDVSYSGEGVEVPLENPPAIVIVSPDDDDSLGSGNLTATEVQRAMSRHPRRNNDLPQFPGTSKYASTWQRLRDHSTSPTASGGRSSPDTSSSSSASRSVTFQKSVNATPAYTTTSISKPYKIEQLRLQVAQNSPGIGRRTAVIASLKDMGIKVFVLDGRVIPNSYTLLRNVKRVIEIAALENYNHTDKRCLLYQDEFGRLFNVVLTQHTVGPANIYQEYLSTFSGLQAMIALTVLCRSFPCISSGDDVRNLRPAYLSIVLGLVLNQEISLSWLNASMMIRAFPSVSAHTLVSEYVGADYIRKGILFTLAIGGAATGPLRAALSFTGIVAACMVLLANLGSRAWHFLRWQPLRYQGIGATALAYFCAICTGIVLPYMGHRSIVVGGKGAMEYIIKTAIIVALAFAISDIDGLQQFLVAGSQDIVNIVVAAWWFTTFFVSLFIVRRIPYYDQLLGMKSSKGAAFPDRRQHALSYYYDGERVLVEDQSSPVGYKVPTLPDFEFDPSLVTSAGMSWCTLDCELAFGLVVAACIGSALFFLAFTDVEDDFYSSLQSNFGDTVKGIIGTNSTLSFDPST